MLAGGLAEMVTVGSVVPFLTALTGGAAGAGPLGSWPWPIHSTAAAAGLFLAAALTAGALRLLLSWTTQEFALGTGHWAASEVYRRILLQPYNYHVQAHSSSMLSALQKVQDLVWGVLTPLVQGTAAAIMALLILSALVWIDPLAATGAALLFGSLYLLVSILVRRSLGRDAEVVGTAYEQRIRIVQDSLGGIRDIIIDGSQPLHLASFHEVDQRFARARARLGFFGAAPRYVIETVGLAIILLLTVLLAEREGGLVAALPVLGALALGSQRLLPLIQQVYQSWTAVSGNRRVIADLSTLMTLPVEDAGVEPRPPLPFTRELALDDVRFSYGARGRAAIAGISLTIRKGSRVALTGRSGSGKSTLADLIMGLLQPDSGQLLVDGVRLEANTLTAWQRNVAHVPQSVFLTDASLAENIAFGVPPERADRARVEWALATVQLGELVEELEDGLDTRIGERGVRLSGGQRQRLALARAIYRNKPFLVLDEATSALDHETESAILHAIDELQRRGVTILIIAHRNTTLVNCDQRVRLEAGRIVSVESS